MTNDKKSSSAARILVDAMIAHDIDRIFAVPGESYLPLLDELADEPRIDLVTCRHEGGAGFMALADAKLTARPGVVAVSRGPGATNASIALHMAQQDAVPMVLLIGHVPIDEIGRGGFQEIDYHAAFGKIAKSVRTVLVPDQIGSIFAGAVHTAMSGTPGPVVLVLPEDMLAQPAVIAPARAADATSACADSAMVEQVASLLARARRPLLITGGSVGVPAGRRALREVAEAFDAPVALACKCQDFLDNSHPSFAAHLGFNIPDHIVRELEKADLIVAVGTRLGEITTQTFRLPKAPEPAQPLVHVYPDPEAVGRDYRTDVACIADPVAFLQALATAAARQDTGAGAMERATWRDHLHARAMAFALFEPRNLDEGMDFGRVVAEVQRLAARDAIVSLDIGNFSSWLHRHWIWRAEQTMVGCVGAAMGLGVPGAVAAALRWPKRQALCFVGDGGFMMTCNELATARARDLNVKVFISNNGTYGTIRLHQEKAFPGRVSGTELVNPDFDLLGRAFGATTFRIARPEDCAPAVEAAMAAEGLVLVEVESGVEGLSANLTLEEARRLAKVG